MPFAVALWVGTGLLKRILIGNGRSSFGGEPSAGSVDTSPARTSPAAMVASRIGPPGAVVPQAVAGPGRAADPEQHQHQHTGDDAAEQRRKSTRGHRKVLHFSAATNDAGRPDFPAHL
ncbi:hypothetical protein [Nonomuraea sp. NPDC049400]|uniref:hypothetical protein n=1 Tax=Nonomuraea sp. NPDC049400 TaxID=3364352 RepID=UPI0037AD8BF4